MSENLLYLDSSNFDDTIKLAISFMMEAGADALIIPNCSQDTLKLIGNWSTIPIIVMIDKLLKRSEFEQIFQQGMKGILFSEKIIETENYKKEIRNLETEQ